MCAINQKQKSDYKTNSERLQLNNIRNLKQVNVLLFVANKVDVNVAFYKELWYVVSYV